MQRTLLKLYVAAALVSLAAPMVRGASTAAPEWPCWRGPQHNGISNEKGWLAVWPKDGLKQLWKIDLGIGYSSVAVSGGKAYTMGNAKGQDTVFCLNPETGASVWTHSYPCSVKVSYGAGPRATPTVENTVVYTMSVDGQVLCLDAASGKVIWNKEIKKDAGCEMPMYGFSSSPLVEGELLLLNAGTGGLALNKKTGDVVWKSEGKSSWSSPVGFDLAGQRRVAIFAFDKLAVLNPSDGKAIGTYDWKTRDGANCSDPVIVGEKILISSSYGQGCALLGVGASGLELAWKKKFECHFASPVLSGDCIYAIVTPAWMKGDLVCVSASDGTIKWTQKDVGSGGLMIADGKLLILSRSGDLILAEASPSAYTELARCKVFPEETVGGKPKPAVCWSVPVLCDGRIYVRNEAGTLICLDARSK
jgi:outer membrane protein assembly factor BamB